MAKKEINISEYLAAEGRSFSLELYNNNHNYFSTLSDSYYAIASAIALCWTGHAHFRNDFIRYAASFIDGSAPKDASAAINHCKRFGPEQLDNALTNYRIFYGNVKSLMPEFNTCSIQVINNLQVRLLSKLDELRNTSKVSYIGPWLFLGPFKIILGDQQRLWNNEGLNSIILPTGMEVDRGIVRLKKEGYKFMKDFDLNWLQEHSGSLLDNYASH